MKEAFEGTGLEWDEKYEDVDLADGCAASGGRLGEYPGGIVVSAINLSGETKKIPDCAIDDATFYFGDENDEFKFPGGITKDSGIEDVNDLWEGVEPNRIYDKDDAYYVEYRYENPENPYSSENKIEYRFFKGELKSVSIMTDGRIEP